MLALTITLSSCSSDVSQPSLSAKDLPEPYQRVGGLTSVMAACEGNVAVSRYGTVMSTSDFMASGSTLTSQVIFAVVKETDDRLWDELSDAIDTCGDSGNGTYRPTSGPKLGDKSFWYTRTVDFSDLGVNEPFVEQAVVVKTGSFVFLLQGSYEMSQDEVESYAKAAMD